jgi:hypothetical protein
MNPVLIELAIKVLVMYGPAAYKAVVDLLHNTAPTKADFEVLLQFATQKSYDDYVHPIAALPVGA